MEITPVTHQLHMSYARWEEYVSLLTQDVRICATPVHRDPQMARNQISPQFVRLTITILHHIV